MGKTLKPPPPESVRVRADHFAIGPRARLCHHVFIEIELLMNWTWPSAIITLHPPGWLLVAGVIAPMVGRLHVATQAAIAARGPGELCRVRRHDRVEHRNRFRPPRP